MSFQGFPSYNPYQYQMPQQQFGGSPYGGAAPFLPQGNVFGGWGQQQGGWGQQQGGWGQQQGGWGQPSPWGQPNPWGGGGGPITVNGKKTTVSAADLPTVKYPIAKRDLKDAFANADGKLDQYGDLQDGNGKLTSSELNRYVDTLANQVRSARAAVKANNPNVDQSDVEALEKTYIAARALKENFAAIAALDIDDTENGDDRSISMDDINSALDLDGDDKTLSFKDAAKLLADIDTTDSALETPVDLDAAIDAVKEADAPGKFGTKNGKVTSSELQQSLLQKAQMLKTQNNLLDDMDSDNSDFEELTDSVNKLKQDTALLNALITNFAVIAGDDGALTTAEITALAGKVTTGTGEGAGKLSQADIDKAVTDAAA